MTTLINSSATTVTPLPMQRSRGYWTSAAVRFTRDPVAVGAALVVLLLIAMAVFGHWLAPVDPYHSSILMRLKPIGTDGLLLGSDELGRDMLSRLIVGARLSLFIGITPVVLAFMTGSVIGIVAGYAGGFTNTAIMRTIDVFYAFPSVLLAIALSGVLGAGIVNSLISLTIVFIPQIARVAESVTTQVRGRDYVDAARASGASAFTIVRFLCTRQA
jgi:peptide/nickel transport system permease protein